MQKNKVNKVNKVNKMNSRHGKKKITVAKQTDGAGYVSHFKAVFV